MRTAIIAVQSAGLAGALSNAAARAGPLTRGLLTVGRGLLTVKAAAVAAGASVVYAMNKSVKSIRDHRREFELLQAIRSGRATAAEIEEYRMSGRTKTNKAGQLVDMNNKRIGDLEYKWRSAMKYGSSQAWRSTGVNIQDEPISRDETDIAKVAKRYGEIYNIVKQQEELAKKGRDGLQHMVVTNGKMVGIQKVSLSYLKERLAYLASILKPLRKAQTEARLRADQEERSTKSGRSADRCVKKKRTSITKRGSRSTGDGWTQEEMRARAGRIQFEREVAAIRKRRDQEEMRRLEELMAKQKKAAEEHARLRDQSIAVMTGGTTGKNRAYLENQMARDPSLRMGYGEHVDKLQADKDLAAQQRARQDRSRSKRSRRCRIR